MTSISIIIPARNEALSLAQLLPDLRGRFPEAEIIVADDGSTDDTAAVVAPYRVLHLRRPYSMGNGAAVKHGARAAHGKILVFMDGDGQHRPCEIENLLARLHQGYDMVVGARSPQGQASLQRSLANRFYNRFASWMVGHPIRDLTSGFRVVRRRRFLEFLHLLPNTFSYPTTCTMAFFRAGYSVAYEPIEVQKRHEGTLSHIKPFRDGLRFLTIIFKIGTLYSPSRVFAPIALLFFLTGLGYYAYTFIEEHRFSNMSAVFFSASVVIFLIGLISEQITSLMYGGGKNSE